MAKKKNAKKSAAKKSSAKPASELDTINNEVLSAALSVANLPVLLKVCRLCEAKDGPFLNIFEADKMTAKKIETVMPFAVSIPFYICSLLKNIIKNSCSRLYSVSQGCQLDKLFPKS